MSQDELAHTLIKGKAVDAASLHGDDQLRRGAVHGETRRHQLGARFKDVLLGSGTVFGKLVDGKDGAYRHAGVEVGGAVDGVAGDGVAGVCGVFEVDYFFLFFGHQQSALAGGAHGFDEEVVRNHVQLLLLVACGIGTAGQAGQVDQRGAADVVGDGLEGELEGMAEEAVILMLVAVLKVNWTGLKRVKDVRKISSGFLVLYLLLGEESGEGDNVGVHLLHLHLGAGSVLRHGV